MNLSDFYLEDEEREFLRQPFNIDGSTVATDGHRLLRTKLQPQFGVCPEELCEKILVILAELDSLDVDSMKPLEFEWPDKIDCWKCSGVGSFSLNICHECQGEKKMVFTSPQNTYSVTCKSCQGKGELDGLPLTRSCESCSGTGKGKGYVEPVCIEGVRLSANYLEPLVEAESIRVMPSPDGTKLYFRASSGDLGLIYGMKN